MNEYASQLVQLVAARDAARLHQFLRFRGFEAVYAAGEPTALDLALANQDEACCKALILWRQTVRDDDEVALLHAAAFSPALLKLLTHLGHDINTPDRHATLLDTCVAGGYVESARFVLTHPDLQLPMLKVFEAAYRTAMKWDSAMLALLIEGCPELVRDGGATRLLCHAARTRTKSDDMTRFKEVARMLLENGADIEGTDGDGVTPLMRATMARNTAVAVALMELGASSTAPDKQGRDATVQATLLLNQPLLAHLRDRGTDLAAPLADGSTLLHRVVDRPGDLSEVAKTRDFARTVAELIDAGIDINARDAQGATPLMLSMKTVCREWVDILLGAGASFDLVDNEGRNALGYLALLIEQNPASAEAESLRTYLASINSRWAMEVMLASMRQGGGAAG